MTDSNKRDPELDEMLSVFRKIEPNTGQIRAWQSAAVSVSGRKKLKWFQLRLVTVPQFAAALMLAFVIGAVGFGHKSAPSSSLADNYEPSATIEQIYAKAE